MPGKEILLALVRLAYDDDVVRTDERPRVEGGSAVEPSASGGSTAEL